MTKLYKGILLSLAVSVPSWFLGKLVPVIGGAVFSIVFGMILSQIIKDKSPYDKGIKFVSKKVLQAAVVFLGFGLNLNVVMETGKQSLPIIICTIATSLVISYLIHRAFDVPPKISALVGVGSSICGGSAIAATAPVIDADDEDVAQAISVIFFYNILAALVFPTLGTIVGFDTGTGEAFGVFAGTAINDTSSVTAAAATWDNMYGLGNATLEKAVTVKLTRTLAIIPITLILSFIRSRRMTSTDGDTRGSFSFKSGFPLFILLFICASVITTVCIDFGVDGNIFVPFKDISKFLIILAMAAIGLHTDIVKLIKSGGMPLLMGGFCWVGIIFVSLLLQWFLGIW